MSAGIELVRVKGGVGSSAGTIDPDAVNTTPTKHEALLIRIFARAPQVLLLSNVLLAGLALAFFGMAIKLKQSNQLYRTLVTTTMQNYAILGAAVLFLVSLLGIRAAGRIGRVRGEGGFPLAVLKHKNTKRAYALQLLYLACCVVVCLGGVYAVQTLWEFSSVLQVARTSYDPFMLGPFATSLMTYLRSRFNSIFRDYSCSANALAQTQPPISPVESRCAGGIDPLPFVSAAMNGTASGRCVKWDATTDDCAGPDPGQRAQCVFEPWMVNCTQSGAEWFSDFAAEKCLPTFLQGSHNLAMVATEPDVWAEQVWGMSGPHAVANATAAYAGHVRDVEGCMTRYSTLLSEPSGAATFCVCRSALIDTMDQISKPFAAVIAALIFCLAFLAALTLSIVWKQLRRDFREMMQGGANKGYTGIFPLHYSPAAASRQLFFFIVIGIPAYWVLMHVINDLVMPQTPQVIFTLKNNPSQPLFLDLDHCEVKFEQNPLMSSDRLRVRLTVGSPITAADPTMLVSFCGARGSDVQTSDGRAYCHDLPLPGDPKLGFSAGCTNLSQVPVAQSPLSPPGVGPFEASQLCVINYRDKIFADSAYSNWDCVVSVESGFNATFPPLNVRSTERLLYDGLHRTDIHDQEQDLARKVRAEGALQAATGSSKTALLGESDNDLLSRANPDNASTLVTADGTSDRFFASNRYHFCDRRLRFSELNVSAPDVRLQLDCFEAKRINFVDTDQSFYSLFSDSVGTDLVDVELQNGDLYVWENIAVRLQYKQSKRTKDMSGLCLVGDSVYRTCEDRGWFTVSPSPGDTEAIESALKQVAAAGQGNGEEEGTTTISYDENSASESATVQGSGLSTSGIIAVNDSCAHSVAKLPLIASTEYHVVNKIGLPSKADVLRAQIREIQKKRLARRDCAQRCRRAQFRGWPSVPARASERYCVGWHLLEDQAQISKGVPTCILLLAMQPPPECDPPAPAPTPNVTVACPAAVPRPVCDLTHGRCEDSCASFNSSSTCPSERCMYSTNSSSCFPRVFCSEYSVASCPNATCMLATSSNGSALVCSPRLPSVTCAKYNNSTCPSDLCTLTNDNSTCVTRACSSFSNTSCSSAACTLAADNSTCVPRACSDFNTTSCPSATCTVHANQTCVPHPVSSTAIAEQCEHFSNATCPNATCSVDFLSGRCLSRPCAEYSNITCSNATRCSLVNNQCVDKNCSDFEAATCPVGQTHLTAIARDECIYSAANDTGTETPHLRGPVGCGIVNQLMGVNSTRANNSWADVGLRMGTLAPGPVKKSIIPPIPVVFQPEANNSMGLWSLLHECATNLTLPPFEEHTPALDIAHAENMLANIAAGGITLEFDLNTSRYEVRQGAHLATQPTGGYKVVQPCTDKALVPGTPEYIPCEPMLLKSGFAQLLPALPNVSQSTNTTIAEAVVSMPTVLPICNGTIPPIDPNMTASNFSVAKKGMNESANDYYNHVQVEAGVVVDTVASKKSFSRDVPFKSFHERADPPDIYPRKVVKPTISDATIDRLLAVFHFDGAEMPVLENMVELIITADGLPLGHFTWYSNMIYAFIPPAILAFISMGLLEPHFARFNIELVDNFCPIVHMQEAAARREVITRVYEMLYDALDPLPPHTIFTFTALNRTYKGAVMGDEGAHVKDEVFVFQRDPQGAVPYKVNTLELARDSDRYFWPLIYLNIALSTVAALLFISVIVWVSTSFRRKCLFEYVHQYRGQLGGTTYYFEEREMKKLERESRAEGARRELEVTVWTDNCANAGTNGTVFLTMVGMKTEETREIELPLRNSAGERCFQKGSVDTFMVNCADVGPIAKVRIRFEPNEGDSRFFQKWKLSRVKIVTDRMIPSAAPPFLPVARYFSFRSDRWFQKEFKTVGDDEEDPSKGLIQEIDCTSGNGGTGRNRAATFRANSRSVDGATYNPVSPTPVVHEGTAASESSSGSDSGSGSGSGSGSDSSDDDDGSSSDSGDEAVPAQGKGATQKRSSIPKRVSVSQAKGGLSNDDEAGDGEDDDSMGEGEQLDPETRERLNHAVTKLLEPRASLFWFSDTLLCAKREQKRIEKATGSTVLDSDEVEKQIARFQKRLTGKYLQRWIEKSQQALKQIANHPDPAINQLQGNLELDEEGRKVICRVTGGTVGSTVIRKAHETGLWQPEKTAPSGFSVEEIKDAAKKAESEVEADFTIFDTGVQGVLGSQEIMAYFWANGNKITFEECQEMIDDLVEPNTDPAVVTPDGMPLPVFKTLVRLLERKPHFEAEQVFFWIAEPRDKKIRPRTLKRVCKEQGEHLDDRQIMQMFDLVDAGGDGEIDLNEFLDTVGAPVNAQLIAQEVSKVPIPDLVPQSDGTADEAEEDDTLLGGGTKKKNKSKRKKRKSDRKLRRLSKAQGKLKEPSRVIFDRLLTRYYHRYTKMMPDEQKRFFLCCAHAARPGVFCAIEQISATTLARLSIDREEAKALLLRIRQTMRIESMYSYLKLNPADQKELATLLLSYSTEYFRLKVTQRMVFAKLSLSEKRAFLVACRKRAQKKKMQLLAQNLWLEIKSVICHLICVVLPSLPLFLAGLLFDKTYKKFEPSAPKDVMTPELDAIMTLNYVYWLFTLLYLVAFYLHKMSGAKSMKEGPAENVLRKLNQLALFVMMLVFMYIMVSVMFWTILGTVLNPEGLIPVFAAFTTVLLHIKNMSGALKGVRAKLEDRIKKFKKKGDELKKRAQQLSARVNKAKKEKSDEAEKAAMGHALKAGQQHAEAEAEKKFGKHGASAVRGGFAAGAAVGSAGSALSAKSKGALGKLGIGKGGDGGGLLGKAAASAGAKLDAAKAKARGEVEKQAKAQAKKQAEAEAAKRLAAAGVPADAIAGGAAALKDPEAFKKKAGKAQAAAMGELAALQDGTRGAVGSASQVGNIAQQFLMDQGLGSAEITFVVGGSGLLLILLLCFIFVGVKAFSRPGAVTAGVNTSLVGMTGKGVNGQSKGGLDGDSVERMLNRLEELCNIAVKKATEVIKKMESQFGGLLRDMKGQIGSDVSSFANDMDSMGEDLTAEGVANLNRQVEKGGALPGGAIAEAPVQVSSGPIVL